MDAFRREARQNRSAALRATREDEGIHIMRMAVRLCKNLGIWPMAAAAALLSPPAQAEGEPAPARDVARPTLGGLVQLEYRRGDTGGQKITENQEWNAREVRLSASGGLGRRVRYVAVAQGDGLRASSASVVYAFMDFRGLPWLSARVGQFKYSFDIEGRELGHERPLSDVPFVTKAVAGGLNGLSSASKAPAGFTDRGISVSGSGPLGGVTLGYVAGLFQGAGRAMDNNRKVAMVVGASAQTKSGFRLNSAWLSSDNTLSAHPDQRDSYRAWTAGASLDRGRWLLRGEYYDGQRKPGDRRVDVRGHYATAGYSVTSWLDLVARHQSLEQRVTGLGRTEAAARLSGVDLGMRCFLDRRERRSGSFLSVSYAFRGADDAPGNPLGLTVLNDGRGQLLEQARDLSGVLVVRLQTRF
jgi:hypothetical protein